MRGRLAIFPLVVLGLGALQGGCYDIGDGTAPPRNTFYFPVGLQVSNGGTVLYAVNSDFDLQFNGGTLQSYDLRQIRHDALIAIQDPADPHLPFAIAGGRPPSPEGDCPANPRVTIPGTPVRQPLGETCAPPVDSTFYFRDSAVIGAFATGLLLSPLPGNIPSLAPKAHSDDPGTPTAPRNVDRLFAAVRGNATVTWASVFHDTFDSAPTLQDTKTTYAPFRIDCGQDTEGRCDAAHEVGADINEPGDTRHITLPGEPFGFSFSQDATTIVITHQNDPDTTLVTTGLGRGGGDQAPPPAIQFVLDRLPLGGMGVAPIPHDPDAFLGAGTLPRGAFLETNRTVAEVSLLRQYPDDGEGGLSPSIPRPFLDIEANFPIAVTTAGTDSRGIVIDPTPRIACKAKVLPVGPGRTQADRDRDIMACARKPARAFIANRTPPALLVGDVGTTEGIDGSYDPDRLILHTSIPLAAGPSNVYLAPVVDSDGAYSLRVWVVCFDSATIYVYNPDAGVLDNVLHVGVGPFAMAFDPFTLEDVATHAQVPIDPRDTNIRRYRFAYVGSFTQSYVQLIDLDNAAPQPFTYQRVVYTLGVPMNPKGT
jgi:hypothetical protein